MDLRKLGLQILWDWYHTTCRCFNPAKWTCIL